MATAPVLVNADPQVWLDTARLNQALLRGGALVLDAAARVAARRAELGLTQAAVSRAAGYAGNLVARIEAGDNSAAEVTRVAVAAVLRCRVSDLWVPLEGDALDPYLFNFRP